MNRHGVESWEVGRWPDRGSTVLILYTLYFFRSCTLKALKFKSLCSVHSAFKYYIDRPKSYFNVLNVSFLFRNGVWFFEKK